MWSDASTVVMENVKLDIQIAVAGFAVNFLNVIQAGKEMERDRLIMIAFTDQIIQFIVKIRLMPSKNWVCPQIKR
jgi:hypothetical protein